MNSASISAVKEGLDINPSRWPDVSRIFSAAAPLDGPSRNEYLEDACRHDPALRAEVESLLRAHDNAGSFGETPIVASLGTANRLTPGSQLGPFLIETCVGVGGMGEVYRALDTKLQRAVAIKVLPDVFAQDSNRLARFEEEARALAALNHPHIGAIYGVEESAGVVALVLELVEGPTLADRLAAGPLTFDEVVWITRQLADGLEAAHERGIVHRDFKPANIKITPDGSVKILDFGLAKVAGAPPGAALTPSTASPRGVTQAGTVLGTVGYMSPEQARGQAVDKRADIWAFGCILFEMCARQPPFAGATIADAHAAVMEREPDWGLMRADTPRNLVRLLRRCLTKDSKLRLRDIGEARISLSPDAAAEDVPVRSSNRRYAAIGAVLGLVALASIVTAAIAVYGRPVSSVTRLDIALPDGDDAFHFFGAGAPALTPDGRTLVYVANRGGTQYVFRRRLDQTDSEIVSGTEGAMRVHVYPAGDWLAFTVSSEGLKKVPLSGGPPAAVYQPKTGVLGLDFTSAGDLVVGDHSYGLFRVPAAGGEPVSLLPDSTDGTPRYPVVLPGARGLLFTVGSEPVSNRIAVLPAGAPPLRILTSGTDARYLSTGHIVFWRDGSIWAAPFDLDRLQLSGDAVPVVNRVGVMSNGGGLFAVSANGTLAYMSPVETPARTLVWVDHNGRETALGALPGPYMEPRLSPDEQKVLLSYRSVTTEDIWLYDVNRQTTDEFLAEPASEWRAFWSADGDRALVMSRREGGFRTYAKRANGLGGVEKIVGDVHEPYALTPDGIALIHPGAAPSRTMSLTAIADGTTKVLWTDEVRIRDARISPDKKWIAYSTGPTVAQQQIWVRPYPDVQSNKWPVSPDGGRSPRWSSDSRTIYYRNGDDMMAAKVSTGPGGAPRSPKKLFSGPYQPDFDIASDGRFLMIKEPASPPLPERRIIVVLNWFQELKDRVGKR